MGFFSTFSFYTYIYFYIHDFEMQIVPIIKLKSFIHLCIYIEISMHDEWIIQTKQIYLFKCSRDLNNQSSHSQKYNFIFSEEKANLVQKNDSLNIANPSKLTPHFHIKSRNFFFNYRKSQKKNTKNYTCKCVILLGSQSRV